MSKPDDKIISLESKRAELVEADVLCYGHFSVLHPGHFRYLNHAAKQGARLSVLIKGDFFLKSSFTNEPQFSEKDRALSVASLNVVDEVIIQNETPLHVAIRIIHPKKLILGKEFEEEQSDEMRMAIAVVKSWGGLVEFHAGETSYSVTKLTSETEKSESLIRRQLYRNACKNHGITNDILIEKIRTFANSSLVVIGDTIMDQYIACDAIGMSAEAPVVAFKEVDQAEYLGGAAIVAAHVRALGAKCHFISVTGEDLAAERVAQALQSYGVVPTLKSDRSRPTTYKIRYMSEQQKIFRVSRIKDHNISQEIERSILDSLHEIAPNVDAILVCDFVYGCVTPNIISTIYELAKKHDILLLGDLQCSSQIGSILKFHGFNTLFPTEREARICLGNKDDGIEHIANEVIKKAACENLILKLGAEGFITYQNIAGKNNIRQHFPALVTNPLDVAGAGDSLLAGFAVSMCSKMSIMEASALAAFVAAEAVSSIGNKPIKAKSLIDRIRGF